MNQKEAIAVIKARGWRLRSKSGSRFDAGEGKRKPTRVWYVLDEYGNVQVSPRYNKGVAIDWAIVMITGDWERQTFMRVQERIEMWGDK